MSKFSTVDEICELLGVKKPRVYELARLWERTEGQKGLPCIRLGERQLRFSRAAIERYLAGNPVPEAKEGMDEN